MFIFLASANASATPIIVAVFTSWLHDLHNWPAPLEVDGGSRRNGAAIDHYRIFFYAVNDAIVAEEHFLDIRGIGHAEQHDFRRAGDAGRRLAVLCASHNQFVDFAAAAI